MQAQGQAEAAKAAALQAEQERLAEQQRLQAEVARLAALVEEQQKAKEQAVVDQFKQQLYSHPVNYVKYPVRSLQRREEGVVQLDVKISETGQLMDVQLAQSSGYSRLDKAAIEAVEKANPFPSLPEGIEDTSLRFPLPLAFRIP